MKHKQHQFKLPDSLFRFGKMVIVIILLSIYSSEALCQSSNLSESIPTVTWEEKTYVNITSIPDNLQSAGIVEQENWTSTLLDKLLSELIGTGIEKLLAEITTTLVGNVFSVIKAVIDEIPLVGGSAYHNLLFLSDGQSSDNELIANKKYVLMYTFDNRGSNYYIPSSLKLEKAELSILGVVLSWSEVTDIPLLTSTEETELLETGYMSLIYVLKESFNISEPGKYRLGGIVFSVLTDTESPKIIDTQVEYSVNGNIQFWVSEDLNQNTLNSSNIFIAGTVSGTKEFSIDYVGNIITLNPSNDFNSNDKVTISLSSEIRDLAGNSLIPFNLEYYINNAPPSLTNYQKIPLTGDESTEFKFSVDYYDADGDVPISACLTIAGNVNKTINLSLENGSESEGTYSCSTNLPVGNYIHRITFINNSNQSIQSNLFDGPIVYNSENMTIIPYLYCGVESSNEIELRYDINDGTYVDLPLKVGKNSAIELPPSSKLDLSVNTKGNFAFNEFQLIQSGEIVWDYGHCCTSIQFTDFASGTFELKIYLDYIPQQLSVSGIVQNDDRSLYTDSIIIELFGYNIENAVATNNGIFTFNNVNGGVPLQIKAIGAPEGFTINPKIYPISNLWSDETNVKFTISSDDNKVPSIQLTGNPSKESSNKSVNFSWIGSDNVTTSQNLEYQYKLEGFDDSWTDWSTGTSSSYELSNGSYNFILKARDEAGNVSNSLIEYSFIVNGNISIEENSIFDGGIWATNLQIIKKETDNADSTIILLPSHSLVPNHSLIPVRLYRQYEKQPIGAHESIARRLNLDTAFIENNEVFTMKIPDKFDETGKLNYVIEWGKRINFGWKEKIIVPLGFPNLTDNPPYNSSINEDRLLDDDHNLWRVATTKKSIPTDNVTSIYDSWTYLDKANKNGLIINEREIESILGSWESGVRYSRVECDNPKLVIINDDLFVSILESKDDKLYDSDGSYDWYYSQRWVIKKINKNGILIKTTTSDWMEGSISLQDRAVNNYLWILREVTNTVNSTRSLLFTIVDQNGYVIKENQEILITNRSHYISWESTYQIGSNVMILFEESWETANGDDRTNISYQIRNNQGDLIKSTTVLNQALLDESVELDDEYEIESVISDHLGRIWISFNHSQSGSSLTTYMAVIALNGNIVHEPSQTGTFRSFTVSDKDNYVWAKDGNKVVLIDSVFNELDFSNEGIIFPYDNIDGNPASVNFSSYQLFDRWTPETFTIDFGTESNFDNIQMYQNSINDDVFLSNVNVVINDSEQVKSEGKLPDIFNINFPSNSYSGINKFSVSQSSLLGGSLIFSVPLKINNAPSVEDLVFEIDENISVSTFIGIIEAIDPNNDELSFSVISGNELGAFQINQSTGEITVANAELLDFETSPSFELYIMVNDGELSDTATIILNLNDVNESPIISNVSFTIDENSLVGTSIGTVSATDPEDDTLTFSIVSGNNSGAFQIDKKTGEILVINSEPLDFETNPIFELTIKAYDNVLFDTATITVYLNDVDDSVLGTFDIQGNKVILYPNPTKGFIQIEWNNFVGATVYELSGKELLKSDNRILDCRTLTPGVYLISISGLNNERITFRIIVHSE